METVEHQAAQRHLQAALEEKQYRLHYQPQIDPRTGRIVGAEALLRWRGPAGELFAPGHFLHALEATGLIVPVGLWAFRQAAEDCQGWQRLGLPRLKMGLNVSPAQLGPSDVEALVEQVVQMRGTCDVQIEISGRHLLAPPDWLLKSLEALRATGADITVQDFGLDDSIHKRLWALPVDALKIHRSFISRMSDGEVDDELAGMFMLARAFRMGSVAEGVETEEQLKRLGQLYCERSQGFLHSPPVSPDRFAWMLRDGLHAPGVDDPHMAAAFDA